MKYGLKHSIGSFKACDNLFHRSSNVLLWLSKNNFTFSSNLKKNFQNPNKSLINLKASAFTNKYDSTIVKDTHTESIMKPQYDYTKHTILQYLYMFLFNKDNIGYILHDPDNKQLIGVDFGEFDKSKKIVEKLEKSCNAELKFILNTHGHGDHCGGNEEWKKHKPDLQIIGGNTNTDLISGITTKMNDLETKTFGQFCIACMFTPGHTKTHVSYLVTHVTQHSTKIPILFCGDTLFIGGCGRIFDGTAEELLESLKKLSTLPPDTLVFPGHEYTLQNLEFCFKLDPTNPFIGDKIEWVKKVLKRGDFTVGSRLIDEKLYNPFLKAGEKYYLDLTSEKLEIRSFKKLRKLKDQWPHIQNE